MTQPPVLWAGHLVVEAVVPAPSFPARCRGWACADCAASRMPTKGTTALSGGTSNASVGRAIPKRAALGLGAVLLALASGCRPAPNAVGEMPMTEAKTTREEVIVVTIVYDNYPFDERLQTTWGFGCVVTGLEKTILFDTGGDGRILLTNMRTCGIKPDEIKAVVLSHIHADHTGGLDAFLQANSRVTVYLPKVFPERLKHQVRNAGATLIETEEPCKVCDRVWTTGVLDGSIPEQGLYLKGPDGLIVITGCAHPGIVRMAKAAREHADLPVYAVVGGFHMAGASRQTIQAVIEGLRGLGVRRVAPCHCSGDETRRWMKEAFGQGCLPSGAGARLVFGAETDPSGNPPE